MVNWAKKTEEALREDPLCAFSVFEHTTSLNQREQIDFLMTTHQYQFTHITPHFYPAWLTQMDKLLSTQTIEFTSSLNAVFIQEMALDLEQREMRFKPGEMKWERWLKWTDDLHIHGFDWKHSAGPILNQLIEHCSFFPYPALFHIMTQHDLSFEQSSCATLKHALEDYTKIHSGKTIDPQFLSVFRELFQSCHDLDKYHLLPEGNSSHWKEIKSIIEKEELLLQAPTPSLLRTTLRL